MEEQYISYETARLLKGKGIQLGKMGIGYSSDGKLSRYRGWAPYPAITQSLLQKWLREVHGIHITITPYDDNTYEWDTFSATLPEFDLGDFHNKTYEDALESCFGYILLMI